ncbi:O-antigen ligase family protein [Paucibacter soli]|uniref:O-antigen ligase family protein n=1 Tax=Paucibacter soli TaxID=3133433 RepID=UPI0030AA4009
MDPGLDARARWRILLWAGLGLSLAMLLTVLSGGRPVLLALPALVFTGAVLLAPLLGLALTIITHIIWLLGAYAPGGISLLALSKLFTGLTLLAWLQRALRDHVALTYAPHMLALAAFVLVVLLAPVLTPAFADGLIGIGKYLMMVLPYFLVANLALTRRALRVVAIAISAAATLAALLALVERFLPGVSLNFGEGINLGAHTDAASLDGGLAIKRVTGGIGDANWFSYTMVTALPLCLYWFIAFRAWWVRLAAVAMALLQAVGVLLSYTRTPLIGLAGALLFLLWKRRLPLLPVLVLGTVLGLSAPLWLPDGLLDRFFSEKYLREGSTPMRREIFGMAVQLIEMRPLLGHGYQQFGPQFIQHSKTEMGLEWERRDEEGSEPAHLLRAHNLYLDVWVMHGLIGLLPLLIFYALLLRELGQVVASGPPPEAELALALMACLISFYLCGLGGHSQELKIFWVMAGLAAALRRVAYGGAVESQST